MNVDGNVGTEVPLVSTDHGTDQQWSGGDGVVEVNVGVTPFTKDTHRRRPTRPDVTPDPTVTLA